MAQRLKRLPPMRETRVRSLGREDPLDWFPVPCTNRKYISLHITCAFRLQKVDVKVLVAQWCPTACYPMDCNPPGSSVHEVLQARILEWVASPFSRGSSQSSDRTQISCIAGTLFTT